MRDDDFEFGSIVGVEGNTTAVSSADGLCSISFRGDNNIFFFFAGGDDGVDVGVDTFIGERVFTAIISADGFEGGICFDNDNNVFFGKGCDIFVEGGHVDGGMIEKPS